MQKTRNELTEIYFYNIPRKEGFFNSEKKWENNYSTGELKIKFIKKEAKSLFLFKV